MVLTRYSSGPMVISDPADEYLATDAICGIGHAVPRGGFGLLSEEKEIRRNDILVWTRRTAAYIEQNPHFARLAHEAQLVILPRDDTPIAPSLAGLRRLQWTNAVDVQWQWRVAIGAPPDHVRRPKH
jgi:hypothetical protein